MKTGGFKGIEVILNVVLDLGKAGLADSILTHGGEGLVLEGAAEETRRDGTCEGRRAGNWRGAVGRRGTDGGSGAKDENGFGLTDLGEEKCGYFQFSTSGWG